MPTNYVLASVTVALCATSSLFADTFGSGGNTFSIDFVSVGNPGNGDDTGAGGSTIATPFGGVPYAYRMGVTEIAQGWIAKATNLGLVGVTTSAWTGDQPAAGVTWFEAAAFVNWLNDQRTPGVKAYDLTWTGSTWTMNSWTSAQAWQVGGEENLYRHKDAYYFLPSEDEWYKTAYHQNDGVTANYWDFATQSNTAPSSVPSGSAFDTAVYAGAASSPANVDISGGLSAYGTRGQGGNLKEWIESAYLGLNDDPRNDRTTRGGSVQDGLEFLRADSRIQSVPFVSDSFLGFRIASVPEPSAAMLLLSSGFAWTLRRRNRSPRGPVAA